MHPLTNHEIARLGSDEKLARGLAAHAAARAREAQRAELSTEPEPVGRLGFIGRARSVVTGMRRSTRPAI